jgi:hypothetical protein
MIIQFDQMKKNYLKYNELLFVDATLKHKSPAGLEFTLMLLSGVNNEGKNVLFAVALLREAEVESFKWVFKCFMEFSLNKKERIYP